MSSNTIIGCFALTVAIAGIFFMILRRRKNKQPRRTQTAAVTPPSPKSTSPRDMPTLRTTIPPSGFDPEATEHGVPRLQMMSLLLTDGRDSKEQTRSAQQLDALRDRIGDTAAQVSQNSDETSSSPPRMETLWDFLQIRQSKATETSWWILTIRWDGGKDSIDVVLPLGPNLKALQSYREKSEYPTKSKKPTFVLLHVSPLLLGPNGKAIDLKHRKIAQEQSLGRRVKNVRPFYPSFPDEMLETLF